jgi:hypothetical protein
MSIDMRIRITTQWRQDLGHMLRKLVGGRAGKQNNRTEWNIRFVDFNLEHHAHKSGVQPPEERNLLYAWFTQRIWEYKCERTK